MTKRGTIAYFGTVEDSVRHFTEEFKMQADGNPAEFLLDAVSEVQPEKIQNLVHAYMESDATAQTRAFLGRNV